MTRRRPAVVDVPLLLERLGIEARRIGPRKWEAKCPEPSHETRSGSPWYIRDDPGEPYHACHSCLSCGFRGGPMKLVAIVLDLTPEDAVAWLEEMPPIARPVPSAIEVEFRPRFDSPLVLPDEVEFAPLEEWPSAAREYLITKRRVLPAQVERWGLGYASDGDLAERVVVPVRDAAGRLLSYTARTWRSVAKRKYREPAREERPSASAVFGEEWWSRERDVVVVTEGAFNAMAVDRVYRGAIPVAALMGSSLHPSQIVKLATFRRVVIATDQDKAGRKAYADLREKLVRHVREVTRAELPEGIDCDLLEPEALRSAVGV